MRNTPTGPHAGDPGIRGKKVVLVVSTTHNPHPLPGESRTKLVAERIEIVQHEETTCPLCGHTLIYDRGLSEFEALNLHKSICPQNTRASRRLP